MTVTNQNLLHEENKSRLIKGNAYYHSVQNLMSSCLLSKKLTYKTIIFPVVLYGCETWTFIVREEYRLKVFQNRMLRSIYGPKRDEMKVGKTA
jgi:hypothetical protein